MQPIEAATTSLPELAEEPKSKPRDRSATSGSLYRVIWRWHFYAGLLVTPVLFVVTVTGALYIFRSEIEDALGARWRFVEPGASRKAAQELVDLAKPSHPSLREVALELSSEPDRAAIVRFGDGKGFPKVAAYLDPYRGRVLGSVGPGSSDGPARFFEVVLDIHRQLFLGNTGRVIVELTVGWTVLLLVTGLYLWWPDSGAKARGVWYPRLRRAKPYIVLRDLHSVGGFYLLAPVAVIVVTGLFYCLVWSEAFYLATGPKGGDGPKVAKKAADEAKPTPPPGPLLTLDRIVELAGERYPGRNLFVTIPEDSARVAKVGAANDYNNSYGPYVSAQFELDRVDGRMVAHKTLAEDPRYWWHGWVYTLHVGSIYGTTTKVIWLIACLALAALPVTGLWMWWIRRPSGRTGFPRRPDRRIPPSLIATIAALSVLLPVVGASIVLILAGEWAIQVARRVRVRPEPGPT